MAKNKQADAIFNAAFPGPINRPLDDNTLGIIAMRLHSHCDEVYGFGVAVHVTPDYLAQTLHVDLKEGDGGVHVTRTFTFDEIGVTVPEGTSA